MAERKFKIRPFKPDMVNTNVGKSNNKTIKFFQSSMRILSGTYLRVSSFLFYKKKGGIRMIVNGKEQKFEGFLISEILKKLNLNKDKVVVELNLEIIPTEQYDKTILREEDKVEIVAFVGGG